MVGAGMIGSALFGYQDFKRQGFFIHLVVDSDPGKVGQRWGELEVRSDAELESLLHEESIEIVIVAVPAEGAQGVVDRVVRAGVRGIMNFAPTQLRVPASVELKNVNMAMEMEGLSYALARGRHRGGARART
jgi:redox-sensing transcriptional repressor